MSLWGDSLEAAGLFWLSNEEDWCLLGAICVASKSNCNPEFLCLLPTHLLGGQAAIWRGKWKQTRLIEIPSITRCNICKLLLDTYTLSGNTSKVNRTSLSMPPELLYLVGAAEVCHPAISSEPLILQNIHLLLKPLSLDT